MSERAREYDTLTIFFLEHPSIKLVACMCCLLNHRTLLFVMMINSLEMICFFCFLFYSCGCRSLRCHCEWKVIFFLNKTVSSSRKWKWNIHINCFEWFCLHSKIPCTLFHAFSVASSSTFIHSFISNFILSWWNAWEEYLMSKKCSNERIELIDSMTDWRAPVNFSNRMF